VEKKTFKNPFHISHSSDWIEVYEIENTELSKNFNEYDWDFEITFTNKVKPIRINSVVRHRNWPVWMETGEPIYFVVKAVIGDQAWIGYKDRNREDMLTSLDRLYVDE